MPNPTATVAALPLRFHLTPKSANRKTGPIPVSTSSAATCPSVDVCPFKENGCYALGGPLALHWRAVTAGERGTLWGGFLAAIAALPHGQLWRHNQAGDLYRPATKLGRVMLDALVAANRGRRGFTYSHHRRTPAVVQAFKAATANGFTVNASCHSEGQADAAMANGLRAVFVVPAGESRVSWQTEGGNRAVVCPAQRLEAMDCATCQLCQRRPANVAIAFKAHGRSWRAVEAALVGAQ